MQDRNDRFTNKLLVEQQLKEKHKSTIEQLQRRHIQNVKNIKEKMNAHKEFVAKSVERRQKQEEHIKQMQVAEQKKWEELKER